MQASSEKGQVAHETAVLARIDFAVAMELGHCLANTSDFEVEVEAEPVEVPSVGLEVEEVSLVVTDRRTQQVVAE